MLQLFSRILSCHLFAKISSCIIHYSANKTREGCLQEWKYAQDTFKEETLFKLGHQMKTIKQENGQLNSNSWAWMFTCKCIHKCLMKWAIHLNEYTTGERFRNFCFSLFETYTPFVRTKGLHLLRSVFSRICGTHKI